MKIKWWAAAPKNDYMCLVVIWYRYKSTIESILFRFSLLIGNLDVSGAVRSDVTFLWRYTRFVQGHGVPEFVWSMGLWNGISCILRVFGAKYQGPTSFQIIEKGPI